MAAPSLRTIQRSLISRPILVYVPLATLIAFFALSSSPSFFPLILLLATVRLYVTTVASRKYGLLKLVLMVACLSVSMAAANVVPSFSALPAHIASALICLDFLTTLTCIIAVVTIYADTKYRASMHTPWTRLLFFPTLWASALFIMTSISPIGRLAMWTPVSGIHAYSWLRPYFGAVGIDWIVAAWAVVLHELLGMWIIGSPPEVIETTEGEGEHLIDIDDDSPSEAQHRAQQPRRSQSLLYLSGLLCLLAIPSYSFSSLPTPLISKETTWISLSCALPLPSNVENENNKPALDDYIRETQRLTPLAKVVLWPEGAVRLDTLSTKSEIIERVKENAGRSVVAVSFEDLPPPNAVDDNGPRRHGIMFIDKNGFMGEYYKRSLLPCKFMCHGKTRSS